MLRSEKQMKPKLIRVTTVPITMNIVLKGQLSFMNQYFEVIGITGYDHKHFNEVIEREGIKMHALEMKRAISPIADLKSLWRLYRILKKEKPHIVHSITPKAGLLTMIAAYFAGVSIRMHTFTGLVFPSKTGIYKSILITMDRLLCFYATHVYPEGEGVKSDLVSYRITKKPLRIIANGNINGVDTTCFSPDYIRDKKRFREQFREKMGIDKTDFIYCFIGRITKEKGIKELKASFLRLLEQDKKNHIKLLLVGSYKKENGKVNKVIERLIKNVPGILSVGRHDDIRPYLQISDVFVLPSHREGFPNVILQAGAMGLPCIVSDINGSNEIVIHNETGLIIPVKDEQKLYDAMKMLLENEALRNQMCCKARSRIVSRYEQSMVWNELLSEYQKVSDFTLYSPE